MMTHEMSSQELEEHQLMKHVMKLRSLLCVRTLIKIAEVDVCEPYCFVLNTLSLEKRTAYQGQGMECYENHHEESAGYKLWSAK